MSLNKDQIAASTSIILESQRLLIIPHANVDPDGVGSALACALLFTQLGKEVTVICPDSKPENLAFLPGYESLKEGIDGAQHFVITINLDKGAEVDKLRYTVEDRRVNIIVMPKKGKITPNQISFGDVGYPYDLLVAVDTADMALFGDFYTDHVDLFSSVPILNIDHHISNTRYGQLQLIDTTAASATEVLYSWWVQTPEWRERITPDIATLLLTGLITDTRSFQNPNTTPRSLEVAAELLERGARQQEIVQHIYKTKPLTTLKIWGRALNRIQMDKEAGIVWSSVAREDLEEMGATSKETAGILDELISTIPDAHVHILFTETEEGGLKASMRSSPAVDASVLCGKLFGGGGHARAAGFRIRQFGNFQLQVLECIRMIKDGITAQQREAQEGPVDAQMRVPDAMPSRSMPPKEIDAPVERVSRKQGNSLDIVGGLDGGGDAMSGEDIVGGLTGK